MLSSDQIRQARILLTRPEESVASIARLLGVSRTTLYTHVPELRDGGRAAVAIPAHAEALAAYEPQTDPAI